MQELIAGVVGACIGVIATISGSLITSNLQLFNIAAHNFVIAFSSVRAKIQDVMAAGSGLQTCKNDS